ncbi:arylsulfatase [Rhodococcus sp. SGAir0479]|uniref:arylsulfatase n=1 Tax=Rhodococcus sp. SGAir0479 TaxID=2567884 RepID=UPI0010CD17CC|nr:arylsulfatase [Rhodococcus sp. SGAir0479]QCQ93587.1 arylsulfatase [Rhodococcus sp. SGAir0479]
MTVPPYARGYEGFEGRIGRTAADSTPSWPATTTARPGAPNVVVVLVDDMGYSDIGPYGSEIDTPNLDRIAAEGVRFTNYHTTPLCSPSRAALLTGLNPHRAGYGFVANADPGFPGVRLELADDVLTLPEILRAGGYATYAVGKWHLVRDANMSPGRDRDSWPTQRGFDRYYGSLEGLNSFFHPNQLISDNSVVDVDDYPEDYYLTDDLTDRAVSYIKDLRAHDADKPFFLYFAHVAMHGPLQAKDTDIAGYRGRYAQGWDRIRRSRFASQLAMGLFPPGTEDARNTLDGFDVPPWDALTAEQQQRYARYMEVYAAMVDSVDQSVGRILDTLDELGERDNTIVVFTSDNGGTAEGGPEGTRSYFAEFAHVHDPEWVGDVPHDPALIGTARLGVHYPRGWAQASNTPFRFFKGQSYAGGVRVPLLVSWPAGLRRDDADAGVRTEFAYVTDLAPTLLELTGVEPPASRKGLPAKSFDGTSVAGVLRDPAARSAHTEQYTEMTGNRGYYRDGWKLLALNPTLLDRGADLDDPRWQLFDVRSDPTELHDLAGRFPEKVAELAQAWDDAAWANTVFPLLGNAVGAVRRPDEDRYTRPVRILAGTPTLERYRSSRLIGFRDFEVDVDLAGFRAGDEGVLVAHGDLQGGYLLYVEHDRLVFGYNAFGAYTEVDGGPVPAGTRKVGLRATVVPALRWDFAVTVDGRATGALTGQVQLIGMAPWTGISVGLDARGPVSWDLRRRRGVFRYRGDLRAVTYHPGAVRSPAAVVTAAEREYEQVAD